jgi:WD40 repeat protein
MSNSGVKRSLDEVNKSTSVGPSRPQTTRDESDDDDTQTNASNKEDQQAAKRKVLPFAHLFLARLPNSAMYERSYLHRDVVSHVLAVASADFFVTASVDGFVKFWKKNADSIEFVKMFRCHTKPVTRIFFFIFFSPDFFHFFLHFLFGKDHGFVCFARCFICVLDQQRSHGKALRCQDV